MLTWNLSYTDISHRQYSSYVMTTINMLAAVESVHNRKKKKQKKKHNINTKLTNDVKQRINSHLAYMVTSLLLWGTYTAASVSVNCCVKGDSSRADRKVHSISCESPALHLAPSQIPRVRVRVRVSACGCHYGSRGPPYSRTLSGRDYPCKHSVF